MKNNIIIKDKITTKMSQEIVREEVDALFEWFRDNGINDNCVSRETGVSPNCIHKVKTHSGNILKITFEKIKLFKSYCEKELTVQCHGSNRGNYK